MNTRELHVQLLIMPVSEKKIAGFSGVLPKPLKASSVSYWDQTKSFWLMVLVFLPPEVWSWVGPVPGGTDLPRVFVQSNWSLVSCRQPHRSTSKSQLKGPGLGVVEGVVTRGDGVGVSVVVVVTLGTAWLGLTVNINGEIQNNHFDLEHIHVYSKRCNLVSSAFQFFGSITTLIKCT